MASNPKEDGQSMMGLIGNVVRDVSDLVRQEIALAKAETSEKMSQLQVALAAIAVGGAIAFAGLIVLLDAAVFALANVMANVMSPIIERFPALPALIVGGTVVIIGIVMIKIGMDRFTAKNLRLSRSMQSMQRDQDVVKGHVS